MRMDMNEADKRFREYTNAPYKAHQFRSHLHHLLSQYSVTTNIRPFCTDSAHSPFSSGFSRTLCSAFLLPSTCYSYSASVNILQRIAYTPLCAEYKLHSSLFCNLPTPLPVISTPFGPNILPITF